MALRGEPLGLPFGDRWIRVQIASELLNRQDVTPMKLRHMKIPLRWSLSVALVLIPLHQQPPPIRGFSPDQSPAQRDWETRFKAIPSTDSLRSYLKTLAARPQHLGSPYGKTNAEWLQKLFASWGLDARIETFEVLFPTPKERL